MTRSESARRLASFWLVVLAMLVAGLPAAAAEKSEAGLMAADRAFAEATARDRLDGWMQFYAEDAVKFVFQGPLVRGKAAVRAADAPMFENPAVRLTWEPTDAGLYSDGRTGFTRGDYRMLRKDDNGAETVVSTGTYLTMWRLEDTGWKVILDTGVPADDHDADDNDDDHGDH